MNPYQAFLVGSDNTYSFEWSSFVKQLPEIVLNDKSLELLFNRYPFFEEALDEREKKRTRRVDGAAE
ncbi:MAG: hypothetical protein EOO20_15955 [Chryseobacterium sp.]|nr:MAG: hypothetical protein EOO20_15955 [Chryseobacterium sp.]